MSKVRGGRKRLFTRLELRRKQYDDTPRPATQPEGATKRPGSHKK